MTATTSTSGAGPVGQPLLDNYRNNWKDANGKPDATLGQRKFAAKLSYKRRQCCHMANQIQNHLEQAYSLQLPRTWKEFKLKRTEVMNYEAYDDSLDKDLGELMRFYYGLRSSGQTIGASFTEGGQKEIVPIACMYNRHRLDPLWNFRKSQLIRGIYTNYLVNNAEGRRLKQETTPCHLVLTVPHAGGLWKGKRFYGQELLKKFNEMRKQAFWKKYVVAGEYGLETKRSKANGLHIHVHALVFQSDSISVNELRRLITAAWQKLVCEKADAPVITWYETLYFFRRKKNGNKDYTEYMGWHRTVVSEPGEPECGIWEDRIHREIKKVYINKNSPIEEYISGILECIKYHFKADACVIADEQDSAKPNYDVELIKDILNTSKGMRFYSRFGKFYKVAELNLNRLDEEDTEEAIGGDVDKVMARMVHPFTECKVKESELNLVLYRPENCSYTGKEDKRPFQLKVSAHTRKVPKQLTVKETVRLVATGSFDKYLQTLTFFPTTYEADYDYWKHRQGCRTP